jgi:hypothetical protein
MALRLKPRMRRLLRNAQDGPALPRSASPSGGGNDAGPSGSLEVRSAGCAAGHCGGSLPAGVDERAHRVPLAALTHYFSALAMCSSPSFIF